MEVTSIEPFKKSLEIIRQFPLRYIRTNGIIKLKEDENLITIGYVREPGYILKKSLKRLSGKGIEFLKISNSDLTSYISRLDSGKHEDREKEAGEKELNILANDAPIINLVNSIIADGIKEGASDIHLEAYKERVFLRYRIDGILTKGESLKPSLFPAISSRIKIMGSMNIMERRLPQDGRITVFLNGENIDLRISTIPLSCGESIVIRLFTRKSRLIELDNLGFSLESLGLLKESLKFPHGLILITGPTGSGKTTTLNAMLKTFNSSEKKIITIEDPVEYLTDGINQIQVNNDIGLTFSSMLKRVLRQDPDIIMIGEIRDRETAELVIRAALTGHLVLSTLHTNDSVSAISRLKDLGIQDYLITSVLKASFAQRLIKKSGKKGRIPVTEGFIMNSRVEELILNGAKSYEIREYLKSVGIRNLYEEGLEYLESGIVSREEVERVLLC